MPCVEMFTEDDSQIEIPHSVPVMVLRGATLFPSCLMPLFIFEHRYRLMLNHALETDRMLCLGSIHPNSPQDAKIEELHPISTVAIVRASVTHDDGTSHIVLQGLRRVAFNAWPQLEPFRIAEISPVDDLDKVEDQMKAKQLATDLIDLTAKAAGEKEEMNPTLHAHLKGISDPGAIADVIAHLTIQDPDQRQTMLETAKPLERIHGLIQHLQNSIAN